MDGGGGGPQVNKFVQVLEGVDPMGPATGIISCGYIETPLYGQTDGQT